MKRLVLLGLMMVSALTTLPAQEDSRLVAAVRLAQDGQGDSARAIVRNLIAGTPQTDTLYPQALYTLGLVSRDAGDRIGNFRRVAVEFAGSAWADDALLGLAQEDFAAGRAEASTRNIDKIRADYPTSSLLPLAAFWGARAFFELRNTAEACRWLAQGLALAGEDIELQNQLNFYTPRCNIASTDAPAMEPSRPDPVPPVTSPTPAAPEPGGGRFAVQVAAANTEAAAQSTENSLRTAGYEPRLVREGGFIKVRVGHFATRSEAAAAASQVRAKLGGSPFVVEEQ